MTKAAAPARRVRRGAATVSCGRRRRVVIPRPHVVETVAVRSYAEFAVILLKLLI